MAEPLSTAASGTAAVGVLALLIGAFGPAAADVMLVVAAALAGSFVALSGTKNKQTPLQSLGFVVIGVMVSLVLSWAFKNTVSAMVPSVPPIYIPSIIALGLGYFSKDLPGLFDAAVAALKARFFPPKKD